MPSPASSTATIPMQQQQQQLQQTTAAATPTSPPTPTMSMNMNTSTGEEMNDDRRHQSCHDEPRPEADSSSASSSSDGDAYDDDDDRQVPEEFKCGITLEIMSDPLMNRDGINYEREAIMEWLNRGNDSCPLTRRPLSYSKLVPNAQLRLKIDQWKLQHGMPVEHKAVPKKIQNMGGTFEAPVKAIHLHAYNSARTEAHRLQMLQALATNGIAQSDSRGGRNQHSAHSFLSPRSASQRRVGGRSQRRRGSVGASEGQNGQETPSSRRRRMVNILDSALSVVRMGHD
eukprot:CAMPEP_0119562122 /NCGR_PEP_ID=MMETSP1352-20130426/19537_1 /TAXON_ID=265584 /ORGANISM="Stauroneis constricta, Strain CCMP1120" /LENGTH=285 /DNA_ID=CAMNT_0007610469 /DNA_START=384 /DNA_END=1241 /DNA_ORIENTATION=-